MIKQPYMLPRTLTCSPADAENITMAMIDKYIRYHGEFLRRYEYLENLYKGFHDIYNAPEKEAWKPDNRLVVNFPKYITDTFRGYGYGVPIKISSEDEAVDEALQEFAKDNELTDHDAEMVKLTCIYGHAWEEIYQDEEGDTKISAHSPKEMFCVYDETVKRRALFAVIYDYKNTNQNIDSVIPTGKKYGRVLTKYEIIEFDDGKIVDRYENPYGYIPCVELMLNAERIGLYEPIANLVEAYNLTIAEKANDVMAFAEAYLSVMGAEVDDEGVKKIRDDRIINFYGTDNAKDVLVQFLTKPTADGTQENLLDRLEKQIYQISQVANLSDEHFGTQSSGVSMAYKLQAMSNLALAFDRKYEKFLRKRYKIFCSLPTNVSNPDSYIDISIKFSRNVPKNYMEEAQTAAQLAGIVSHETQLKLLSFVDDVKAELDKVEDENRQQMEEAMAMTMNMNKPTEE